MKQRLLAFDIETAKPLPDEVTDLLSHRPLGIACAAAVDIEGQHETLWYGRKSGTFAAQMSRGEAQRLVHDLVGFVEGGYTLVTWNGVGFDFNILAEESGLPGECASLALAHIDLMFHIVCSRGFPLALDKVAQGMGLPGKPSGMSGSKAPTLWASGHQADVLGYVVGDCRTTFAALLHESSMARTRPIDRILTCRCDTTLVGRGRSSDSGSHSRGRPHSPARLGSGREDHLR